MFNSSGPCPFFLFSPFDRGTGGGTTAPGPTGVRVKDMWSWIYVPSAANPLRCSFGAGPVGTNAPVGPRFYARGVGTWTMPGYFSKVVLKARNRVTSNAGRGPVPGVVVVVITGRRAFGANGTGVM